MNLAALAERYGTSEATISARLAFLGIHKPAAVKAGELDQLDALAEHLAAGKPLNGFSYTPTSTVEVLPSAIVRDGALTRSSSEEVIVEVDLAQIERVYEFLEKAAQSEWHLPTGVIRQLTGSTPRGASWKRFGFEFVPATRHGTERAWAVRKAAWDFPNG